MRRVLLIVLFLLPLPLHAQFLRDSIQSHIYNGVPVDSFLADLKQNHVKSVKRICRKDNSTATIILDKEGRGKLLPFL